MISEHISTHQFTSVFCSPAAKPNRYLTISHAKGTTPNDILRYFNQTVQTITISYDVSTKRAADTIRYDTRLAHDYQQKAVACFKHGKRGEEDPEPGGEADLDEHIGRFFLYSK